jgi:putative redox protein
MLDRIDLEIVLTGPLTPEQRAKLMEVAGKCPVHRTLTSEIRIQIGPTRHEDGPLGH